MITKPKFRWLGVSAMAAAVFAVSASAHDMKHAEESEIEQKRVVSSLELERARAYFTDTVLTTHDGRDVRFYSDVLDGKTVVISFIFTACEDACPLINGALSNVQKRLGSRMGEDIHFVSITVDPTNDTPEVLAAYREQFSAGPAWDFLTGDADSVVTVSQKMGQVFERESHLTSLLVGNTTTARWRKVPASLPIPVLTEQILQVANDDVETH